VANYLLLFKLVISEIIKMETSRRSNNRSITMLSLRNGIKICVKVSYNLFWVNM
jgi:hypothetical protein